MTKDQCKQDWNPQEVATAAQTHRRARGIFYGWFLAGLGALNVALINAPLFHGMSVWNPVLRNTFGWTAGQMSWAFAVTQVEGFLNPTMGLLIDRLGPRRMVFFGMTIGGSGFVLFSQIQELWHLYAVFLIVSLGMTMGTWLPMMTVMNNWFTKHKSRAMSLVMEGFAISGIFVPLLLAWAIGGSDPNISERFGWRTTALFIGILCLVSAIPIALLVRNHPADLSLRPDGGPAVSSPVADQDSHLATEDEGYTLQEAIRTKTFWLISLGIAATTTPIGAVFAHLGLLLDDRGFSLQTISIVLATYTGVAAISVPIAGYLGDRVPIRIVAFGLSALLPLSMVVLVLAHNMGMFFLFAVLFGIGTARIPIGIAIRGVYFGRKAFGAITGISAIPMNILMLIGPVYAGFMREAIGTYDVAFLSIAGVALLGSVPFLLLGEPPGRFVQSERHGQPPG